MMTHWRRAASLILLLVCTHAAQAAKPTIAVLDFNMARTQIVLGNGFAVVQSVEDTTKTLSADLITYLVKSGKFSVVERDRMKDILKEQEFSESGYISPETAVKVGKLIGADYFVMGQIEQVKAQVEVKPLPYTDEPRPQYEGTMMVNVRIVDSRGGKVVAADKFTVEHKETNFNMKKRVTGDEFLLALKDATVKTIVNGIVSNVFPLKVIKVVGNEVYLNRGEGVDYKVGSILSVFVRGEELVDQDTHEKLGATETEVGTLQITDIQKKMSKANIVTGGDKIKEGSVAKLKSLEPVPESGGEMADPGAQPVNW